MSENPTYASVISNRGFRFLWINQVLVQLAYNTLNFALIIWVFKLVGTHLAVSGLMLAVYLPAVLFGLFAGVLVDISDRRKIILLIDLMLAVCFVLFAFIKQSYPLILLNTFIVNSLAQFFLPSESSSIPLLVSRRQLFLANSLFSLTLYATFMIGFSVGGPLLNYFGMNSVFILGALSLFAAFMLSRYLPVIKPSRINERSVNLFSEASLKTIVKITRNEVSETFSFIRSKLNIAMAIVLMSTAQGVIGILAVILPSYLERVLLIHATDSSYFVILPLGLGMVSGALLGGRLFAGRPRRAVVIPAIVAAGFLFILIGISPAIAQLLQSTDLPSHLSRPRYFLKAPSLSMFLGFFAYLLGFCMVSIIIPCQTVLQENTNQHNRGKIFAVLAALMTAVSAVPVVLAGGLSDLFGVTPIVIGVGIFVFIVGLIAFRPNRFFQEEILPPRLIRFLGQGHWDEDRELNNTAVKSP